MNHLQGIYFSRPEKHPFPGRKFTQFFLKNHYILWFYPHFLSKTTIRHLNYRSLMWCCGGIDACIYIILLIHWNTIYPLTIHSPERLFPLLTIYPFSCNSAIIRFTVRNETPNSFCNSFCATLSSGDVTLIPIMVPELVPMVPAWINDGCLYIFIRKSRSKSICSGSGRK